MRFEANEQTLPRLHLIGTLVIVLLLTLALGAISPGKASKSTEPRYSAWCKPRKPRSKAGSRQRWSRPRIFWNSPATGLKRC